MGILSSRQVAWPTSGVAAILSTAYEVGNIMDVGNANVVRLGLMLSGNSLSSASAKIEWTDDKTNYYPAEVVNSVSSNVAFLGDGEFRQDSGTVGGHTITAAVPPGTYARVSMKQLGGNANSLGIVRAVFTAE